MRLGSTDTFLEPSDMSFRMGRPVANEAFLKALLTYGTYDAYDFFCSDVALARRFEARVRELVPGTLAARVQARTQVDLARAIEDTSYDVFHLGDFTYFLPYLAHVRDLAPRPFPITGITHSIDGTHMHTRFLQLALADLAPYDAVVCTSACAERFVQAKFSEVNRLLRTRVGSTPDVAITTCQIPLGVDDSLFSNLPHAEARRAFSIPAHRTVALSVGRLSLRTKMDWSPILERLGRMRAAGALDRFLLVIAGGGPKEQVALLEQLVARYGLKEHVVVFPNFPPEAKLLLYRSADFYLSLVDNFQETFGLSIIEAMACGLPVIASNFDGYRDSVTDGENGYLIPTLFADSLPSFLARGMGVLDPGVERLFLAQMVAVDLPTLEERILDLCAHPEKRAAMGANGRKRAERYRWNAIIRDYEALWRELGARARASEPRPKRASVITGEGMKSYLHFPSHLLSDETMLRITDTGRDALVDPDVLTRYEDVMIALSPIIERAILEALRSSSMKCAGLRAHVQATIPGEPGVFDFQLLWLIKHGAVAWS